MLFRLRIRTRKKEGGGRQKNARAGDLPCRSFVSKYWHEPGVARLMRPISSFLPGTETSVLNFLSHSCLPKGLLAGVWQNKERGNPRQGRVDDSHVDSYIPFILLLEYSSIPAGATSKLVLETEAPARRRMVLLLS